MTVADALRAGADRLSASSETSRLDAEVLMAHALGVSRSEMLIHKMQDGSPAAFDTLVARRAGHEPVAYITGRAEFFGLEFAVTPDVLIPRADSETLIEAARDAYAQRRPPRSILDLGTGSGALLLAAMSVFPKADGVGVDQSGEALFVAIRNAQALANTPVGRMIGDTTPVPTPRSDRGMAKFLQRDWRKARWREHLGRFDLVLCNPPYVESGASLDPDVREYEPAGALFAGEDGLDDYRILVRQIAKLLNPEGLAIFEIGAGQADSVSELAEKAGFAVAVRHDLANRPRALILS